MYTSISELPTQVTASLDDTDARKWMTTYNAHIPKNPTEDEVAKAKRIAWLSVRTAPSSFSFCIKASIEDIDKDREIIDIDSIKEHMDSFIKYGGNVQAEHGNYNVATIWAWEPMEEGGMKGIKAWGNIFGGDQVYDEARQAFINGRNNLSVAGEATEGRFQCDQRGCYTRRHVKQLLEISLCDVPANKHATMIWYNKKAKLTKSASALSMNVDEYEIHKDYNTCPIQAVKKALIDAGYVEVHATENGAIIKMDREEANAKIIPLMARGYLVSKIDDGLLVNGRENATEFHFKKAYSSGYIDADGRISKSMPADEFQALFEYGLIRKDENGIFRFRPRI